MAWPPRSTEGDGTEAMTSTRTNCHRMARGGRTLVAGLIASLGLWVAIGALPPGDPASEARAADGYIEHIAIGEAESSRFVRIPLNKSLIVHLPQEARDV